MGHMTKNKKIILTIIIVLAILFVLLLIRGSEDTWICVDGEWIKHGVPSAPMPEQECH